jgi:hypothetical protein
MKAGLDPAFRSNQVRQICKRCSRRSTDIILPFADSPPARRPWHEIMTFQPGMPRPLCANQQGHFMNLCFSSSQQLHVRATVSVIAMTVLSLAYGQDVPTSPDAPAPPATQPAATMPAKDLPSASKIIQDSVEALGGKKAIDSVKSMSIKGTIANPMMPQQMTLEAKMGDHDRFLHKLELPGQGGMAAGSDGTHTWMNNPAMGGYQLVPEPADDSLARETSIFRYGLLFRLDEDYKDFKTLDQTQFNGKDCYKVQMTPKDDPDQELFVFFATDDKLLQGLELTQEGPMGEMKTSFMFKDWKPMDDVKVYSTMEVDQMGMMTNVSLTDIEFNTVDPAAFALPEEVKSLVDGAPGAAPATTPGATQPAAPKP